MPKTNMGVSDSEFTQAGNKISSYAGELVEMIDKYRSAVRLICDTAIKDQLICGHLADICEQVAALRDPLQELSAQIASDCKTYTDKIDQADQFLY